MASLTKIIRNLRANDVKIIDDILEQISQLDTLKPEEEKVLYQYQNLRQELLERQEGEVFSIAEIRYAKQLSKRDKVTNKGKRW